MDLDWYVITFVLAIGAVVLSFYAQLRVHRVYSKHNSEENAKGITGAQAAQALLEAAEIHDINIEEIRGVLTDHYDPRSGTLRLSQRVYSSKSLSAIGVAAHEAAHAIQHNEGYAPLMARQNFARFAGLGSRVSIPLVIIGVLLMPTEVMSGLGWTLINTGLLLFTAIVILSLITLPVEMNASSRAIAMLESNDILTENELAPAKRILTAAAWTYIAAALTSVISIIRLLIISRGRWRKG